MDKETFAEYAVKSTLESTLQGALDILDCEDGKSFEEKRDAVIELLQKHRDPVLVDALTDLAIADKTGQQLQDRFWSYGDVPCHSSEIVLRKVCDADRVGYMEMQREYSIMKHMLKEESYCELVWREQLDPKALILTITKGDSYIGYCGIKSTVQKPWEIAIELLPQWTNQGIGYIALSAMLQAIKDRLGETEFRIRIDPGNRASQKLFEKLGAIPNGISEFLLHDHDSLEKCEEDNLHLMDDELIALAKKFDVAPRKLLSHVLEYKLGCDHE